MKTWLIILLICIFVIIFLLLIVTIKCVENYKKVKLKGAILIIASNPDDPCERDNCEIYKFYHKVWKLYMNTFPNIDVFFLYCNPNQSEEIILSKNRITVKCEENYKPGIIIKTTKALQYLDSLGKYSLFLRTNLSSFVNLSKFNELIIKYGNISTPIYAGHILDSWWDWKGSFPHGSGIILNKYALKNFLKIWEQALKNPYKFYPEKEKILEVSDDVIFGYLIPEWKHLENFVWNNEIPKNYRNVLLYRIKTGSEIFHRELLKKYYNKTL